MRSRGFTLVELATVIVIIAILAGIVTISYNGIQSRSRAATIQTDLKLINDYIKSYKAEFSIYPNGDGVWRYSCRPSSGTMFISDFTNYQGVDLMDGVPEAPCVFGKSETANSDTWVYRSNGTDYKLIYLRMADKRLLPFFPTSMVDSVRSSNTTNPTVGYWSSGATSW